MIRAARAKLPLGWTVATTTCSPRGTSTGRTACGATTTGPQPQRPLPRRVRGRRHHGSVRPLVARAPPPEPRAWNRAEHTSLSVSASHTLMPGRWCFFYGQAADGVMEMSQV